MLYLGIEGRYDDVSHHTIYLAENYKDNLRDIEQRHRLSANPSFYVQNACVTDPSLAPEGQSTLYVLLPVTHDTGTVDWTKETPRYRALAFEQMEKIGLHGVEQRIRTEKVVTPTGWTDEFDLYKGATFSMAHSLDQMLHLRPHNRFEDIGQMYLVGGGTHPGSGLPVIFESARITSRLLLEDLKIEPRWEHRRYQQFQPRRTRRGRLLRCRRDTAPSRIRSQIRSLLTDMNSEPPRQTGQSGRSRTASAFCGSSPHSGIRERRVGGCDARNPPEHVPIPTSPRSLPLLAACQFLEREAEHILRTRYLGRHGLPFWLSGLQHRGGACALRSRAGDRPRQLPALPARRADPAGPRRRQRRHLEAGPEAVRSPRLCPALRAPACPRPPARHGRHGHGDVREIRLGPDKIFFTGSTEAGREVLRRRGRKRDPVVVELSGCDARHRAPVR